MRNRDVLLVVETSKQYGRGLLRGIGRYAFTQGNWSMYLEERSLHERLPAWVKDWRGDGIIVRSNSRHMVQTLLKTGKPIVETDPKITEFHLPFVYTDDRATGRLAVEHFLHRGFRILAYCSLKRTRWSAWRRDAFVRQAAARNVRVEVFQLPARLENRDWWMQRDRLVQWLQGLPRPVAVLAENDVCGNRLLDACRSIRLPVPEQVAVLGVDNDPVVCDLAGPALSSIDLNVERIGYEAAALLDRLMKGRRAGKTDIRIPPFGVVDRLSTNTLAVDDEELSVALEYIRRHACEGIQVTDVCEHVLVSRRRLERKFRIRLGRSPKAEITRIQIDTARRLLAQTHLPVSQISQRTGFQTVNYFANVFRRETKFSATAYRKQFR
jgi:LacI family transcriptional regulator